MEWVVGVTEESGEGGAGQSVSTWGWRQSHAGSEGAVDWVVVQVDADAMSVLGMLKQKPGAGEGLLTGSADVAGRLIFTCGPRKVKSFIYSFIKKNMQIKTFFIQHFTPKYDLAMFLNLLPTCLHICEITFGKMNCA